MEKPKLTKEKVESLFETKYIKIFDMQYKEGRHYYNATRRPLDDLVCLKSDEQFKEMRPDAVTCVVILKGEVDKLLLMYEFRYPTGQFLLSPPAGLMDKKDHDVLETAKREIKEETGVDANELYVINPLLFSTPGMTDESNALVCAIINENNLKQLSQEGAEGSELFDGFELIDKTKAKEILRRGTDDEGVFFSVYTFAALTYFVGELYK